MASKIFISYRRSDLGHFALWLADRLSHEFGARSVFIDRSGLPVARNWSDSLQEALQTSDIFIPLVGSGWLKAHDQAQRRRIDLQDDVVRLEITTALSLDKKVLPIFLGHENLLQPEDLPEPIRAAFAKQGIILEDNELPGGVERVIQKLVELGMQKIHIPQVLPDPRKRAEPLSGAEISAALEELPGWTVMTLPRTNSDGTEEFIHRRYVFSGFKPAMRFMFSCVDMIHQRQHHPRWQNTWRTVDVWLTTFDIGGRISSFDVELAKGMQAIYAAGEWRHASLALVQRTPTTS